MLLPVGPVLVLSASTVPWALTTRPRDRRRVGADVPTDTRDVLPDLGALSWCDLCVNQKKVCSLGHLDGHCVSHLLLCCDQRAQREKSEEGELVLRS